MRTPLVEMEPKKETRFAIPSFVTSPRTPINFTAILGLFESTFDYHYARNHNRPLPQWRYL